MRTIVWLAFAACSSGTGTSTHPTGPVRGTPPDAAVAVAPALTDKECEHLIVHVVDLQLRETRPTPPATADESQRAAQTLQSFKTECALLTRESYRCAIEATSVAALTACHATRSSSTSNSSVAPGGISPPAPRSP